MITFWGFRLAGYLFYRILKTKKDERFNGIRESFWKFAMFWTFQTILIFIIMLPIIFSMNMSGIDTVNTISIISIMGFCIWAIGFITESIADSQKFSFRNNIKNKNKWIDTGLWKYSRHPNYFGEILCWIGIFVFVNPVFHSWSFVSALSPIGIIISLLFFSGIPLLEKKDYEKYGKIKEYQRYKRTTSVLIPWFKR